MQLHEMVEQNAEQMDQIEAWVAEDLQLVKVRPQRGLSVVEPSQDNQ